MARYFIYEGNIEKLEAKLATIEHKCAKYNMHFKYEKIGEVYHEIEDDGEKITAKFIEIEVEGTLKHNNWSFIATIDHHAEGNIIRQFNTEIEVPDRYRSTDPICEHCNTRRRRKFTYLVHNDQTDEWKQVGNTCLKEFTCGIDAEAAAFMEQWFKKLEEGQNSCFSGVRYERCYDIRTILSYAKETVDKFGYVSSTAEYESGGWETSTKTKSFNFYTAIEENNPYEKEIRSEAENIGFDGNREENIKYVDEALAWIRSVENTEDSYIHNLKVACSEDFTPYRNIGFVVSLLPTYYRHLKDIEYKEKQKSKQQLEIESSQYQGEKGQRLTIQPKVAELVYSSDSFYGMSYLYKFIDEAGNIYMWYASKFIDTDNINTLTGTVKDHQEYKGVKQTMLTRCKVA